MKRLIECFCLLLALANFSAVAAESSVEIKSGQDLCALFKEMKANLKGPWDDRQIHVKTRKDETLSGELDLTAKGNGTLRIANLLLRVFDEHDDGIVYKGSCLQTEFKDHGKDGSLELQISGVAIQTDEKSDKPLNEEKVALLYKYVQKEKRFVKISKPEFRFVELKTTK